MARLLLVEDEPTLRLALADCLEDEGHRVLVAADGEEGLNMALKEKPALILLDVMMPKLDGFSVCAELRKRGMNSPVLMLTAKSEVEDRVRGLDVGADDYLVKPFSTRELLARVRALLRRIEGGELKSINRLVLGEISIDFTLRTCRRGEKEIDLTAREMEMMRLLAERAGEPVTREEFLDRVWEYHSFPTTRTVDNHVASLRAKLENDPARPRWITTVHRVGYRLNGEGTDGGS